MINKPIRVLFVSSGNSSFGITPFIKSQGDSLEKHGMTVDYYQIKGKGIVGYLKNILPLRKFILNNSYDIVHAHYSLCGWVGLLTFSRLPLIVSYMGCDVYGDINNQGKKTSYYNIILSFLLQPFVNKIIVKSKNLERYIFTKQKCQIIPNGVDFNKLKPIDRKQCRELLKLESNTKVVLFLGSPSNHRKNICLVKKSLSLINDNMMSLVAPYPVSSDQIPLYLNAADVLVLTSLMEGSPNVIKEAMACNCPIVSTDVGDVKEVIGSTDGCYICSFNPEDVAEKIMLALNFKERTNGRKDISHLNEKIIANKIIRLYKDVLNYDK